MKKNNKHKATLILIFFSIGFLFSYPFREVNLGLGLFSGACMAAMVGGLADWFAVTAIFRRPLGIYWPKKIFRTEIIPRNREGIIKGLVDIVENELLSRSSINRKILNVNIYEMLIQYVEDTYKSGELKELLNRILRDFNEGYEPLRAKNLASTGLMLGAKNFDLSTFLSQFIAYLEEKGYEENVIDLIIDIFIGIVKHNKTHLYFTNFVEEVIGEYENGSNSRAMTIKMLMNFVLKKSPSDMAKMLEKGIVDAVYEIKDRDNAAREKIKEQLRLIRIKLVRDEALRDKINGWKNSNLHKLDQLEELVKDYIDKPKTENGNITILSFDIEGLLDDLIRRLISAKEGEESKVIDSQIKELIINLVNKKHGTIGSIVRDRINQFSTDELVTLIEDTAGNDLQMIRINGSVVGGIVGAITYLLTYYLR